MAMILQLKPRLPLKRELGNKARALGHYIAKWTEGNVFHVEIRVSKTRRALIQRVFAGLDGKLYGPWERYRFEKECIIACIRYAEELALREVYGDPLVDGECQ